MVGLCGVVMACIYSFILKKIKDDIKSVADHLKNVWYSLSRSLRNSFSSNLLPFSSMCSPVLNVAETGQ